MIQKENFNILNYIKKEEYSASMAGMRFMLKNIGDGKMEVIIWPEPYAYGKTPEELKIRKEFDLSVDGVEKARNYLNEQYETQQDLWKMS